MTTILYTSLIDKCFKGIDDKNIFGLIRKDMHPKIEFIEGPQEISGIDCYVKRLKSYELYRTPPERFENALILNHKAPANIPLPIGLLYQGTSTDILSGKLSEAYYISQFIEGKTLLESIGDMEEKELLFIFTQLQDTLREIRGNKQKRFYLMDFAPRDIVVTENLRPYLVDTENLETNEKASHEKMMQKQVRMFQKEYTYFLDDMLQHYQDIVFRQQDY